jgi:hypothetical protein
MQGSPGDESAGRIEATSPRNPRKLKAMIREALTTGALAPLTAYQQFVCYTLVPSQSRPGKNDKLPVDPRTGRVASAHDKAAWTDAVTACDVAERLGLNYGVGFVFAESDPFFFVDIDGCLTPDGSDWSPLAKSLVAAFPGAAVEVSSSGKGLHIIGTGRAPAHGCKCAAYGLEFYTEGRFVALTGTAAVGSAATDCSALLPSLVAQFFPIDTDANGAPAEWSVAPCEGWNGPTDDARLLERAMRSQGAGAAFGGKASFRDLYECNVDVLSRVYPDTFGARPYDASSADAALAQHLAFWTGKDCERVKRMMLASKLNRPKWEREDYLQRTILGAVSRQTEFLTDRAAEPLPSTPDAPRAADSATPKPVTVTGQTFLSVEEQMALFAGCAYVCDVHRVLVPGGLMLKPDQFRVMFGGYSFPMDFANERTSRDSWEAFTQSQAYRVPRADASCFRPDLAPGTLVKANGQTLANMYWPVETPRKVGDIGPFLRHLAKVLPNERDQQILLSYMAAVVQYKGVKFQWWPLIQGVEGNGKTLFTRVVAYAVGDRYSYFPNAAELADKFNDWRYGKIFIGVEDIYVAEGRVEIMEALKPMITGERTEIQGKGEKKETRGVCDNGILNSNHKNAVQKHRNDRRFAVFFSAQQAAEDLQRDGMSEGYFAGLYDWLKGDGYAIVSELLHTFPIPDEFNPAGKCQRAPNTSTTEQAIEAGRGSVEQEVLERIEIADQGFAAGWVSSIFLDRLLDHLGASRRIPINKRRELLATLGYTPHPGLPDGRVNNIVLPDAGKPRLYITKDHPSRGLTGPDVARAYTLAQTASTVAHF